MGAFRRDVTRQSQHGPRRQVHSPRRDQRMFSGTANMTHGLNVIQRRPMRGGIRL